MRFVTVLLGLLVAVCDLRASETDLPPRGEGAVAFEIDVCSFSLSRARGV